ncbi:MAG: DUF805 domain-containing protein [Cyanobacteriota bacterium]|jgi:uncharacterized membrane protein YhaH (DUF805 family)
MLDQIITAFTSAWKRSFDYKGRSDRGDYWWFVLASFLILLVLNIIGSYVPAIGALANLYFIAQFVPHLPLAIRRLRDAGKDWQWIFVTITGIGSLWVLYLHTLPTAPRLTAG